MNCKKCTVSVFIIAVVACMVFPVSVRAGAAAGTGENYPVKNGDYEKTDNSYTAYMSRFSEIQYTSDDILHELHGAVLDSEPIVFEISAGQSGFYGIGMSYKTSDPEMSAIRIGLKTDGSYPYSDTERLEFPRMWTNAEGNVRVDDMGNELASRQVLYTEYCFNEAMDETVECGEKFLIYITKGVHRITLVPVSGKIELNYFKFTKTSPLEKYSGPKTDGKNYSGESIVIEGESAAIKSSYFLVEKNDGASVNVSPQSARKSLMNYIGGGNWKTVGEELIWKTPELEEGYYQIGFSYRQNSKIGSKSFRTLKIDGEIPFYEASEIGFSYGNSWQSNFFSDENGTPYLVYFSKGSHELSLSVTAADIAGVREMLTNATAELSSLYVDMTKITGETVDIYRDYDLFSQIGDMEQRLKKIRELLQKSADELQKITGEESGSNHSVIMNMILTVDQMLNNRYEAHKYKSYYYSNYCSVSSVLQDLREMPLDLDKITLTAVGEKTPFEKGNIFKQTAFSFQRFFATFSLDYNAVSADETNSSSITIWVNWGRDQAQAVSSLIKKTFVPDSGINVNLKLVNASVIQAVLSGTGPDCFLHMTRSEPVNLAMRGVLCDLSEFKDCGTVLKRFQDGAEIPYMYKGRLYALPDTQDFYVMFYRKDILKEYGISVPETWEEFDLAAKLLMRNNMSVYLPNSTVTDVAQANVGVGSNNIFPTLLLQNGVELYSEDGKKTNLLSSDAMEVFEKWTGYYSKLKFPVSLDFYNRFRTGTTPLGIAKYTQYTTFKVAAPEIEGLWGITAVPGTAKPDGSVSHATAGGGTGCVILKNARNPKGAWEFLKWWTSADTQLTYSNDLESVLGPTGRVALSNIEALKGLSWDDGDIDELLASWKHVKEIPEYPGSYYVSRSIYQAYWNVVNSNKNTKDMLMKYGKEADDEIARKWKQYSNR